MITPSFSLTATERVLPRLALDFTTASLDPRITFARSGNTATVTNSSGVIVGINANLPRFDHDPITLACKGLLIEEPRANICTYSEQFDNASGWTVTRSSISANVLDTLAPDGLNTADKLVEDTTASASHFVSNVNPAITITTVYTFSCYVKAAERTQVRLLLSNNFSPNPNAFFDLTNGTVLSSANTVSAPTITPAGNGWYRCSINGTSFASGNGSALIFTAVGGTSSYTGNGTSGIYIWGAQLEAGAFATSYIPTTSAALTRNADVATMTGTNFSDWYSAPQGAFDCAVIPKSVSGTKPVVQCDDTTILNTIVIQGNATASEMKITNLGILQNTLSTGTITANTPYGVCGAWVAGSNALSKSGALPSTGTPIAIPSVTQARLGNDGTNYFNGWLQNLRYWPQRIINAEVQAFSK